MRSRLKSPTVASLLAGGLACSVAQPCLADPSAPSSCQTPTNLIRNCDFEEVPYSSYYTQGVLSSEWVQLAAAPGADVYDADASDGVYGLQPSDWDDFTGVVAHEGNRWVAGWSMVPERFGQVLTEPLEPGRVYELSAFLHMAKRADLAHPGSYRLELATGLGLRNRVTLGEFDLNTDPNAWEARSLTFEAPSDANNRSVLIFTPIGTSEGGAYPGLDTLSMEACDECEAPPAAVPPPPPAEVTCNTLDNLLENCDFEQVPYAHYYASGAMPDHWQIFSGYADTFDADLDDGTYGLPPEYSGLFDQVNANAGVRWVAGRSDYGTRMGQVLTTPLEPGQKYSLSAFIHMATYSSLHNAGTYKVELATSSTLRNRLTLGQFDLASSPDTWEARSIAFEAPSDAAQRPLLILTPVGDAGAVYPGLDSLSLVECDECETGAAPEPPPPPAPVTCQTPDNLVRNCDFEITPYTNYRTQGALSTDWLELAPAPGADVYDDNAEDGIYGLLPEDWDNFPGVHAHAGVHWAAGWSIVPEQFGQSLTTPLIPGQKYELSAFLHMAKRFDIAHAGSYRIELATGNSLRNSVVVGEFDMNTIPDVWEARSIRFEAPSDADHRPLLVFTPIGTSEGAAYPGLDTVVLRTCESCETPPAAVPPPPPAEVTCQTEDNLLKNCDFETVPTPNWFSYGVAASDWTAYDTYAITLDADPDDGVYGLTPEYNGFFTGVNAHAGVRYAAGLAGYGSRFGQTLTEALEPGEKYELSAFVHQAISTGYAAPGTYQIGLATGNSLSNTVIVGQFDVINGSSAWEARSMAFEAPSDADNRPILVFIPVAPEGGYAYVALDSVELLPCESCQTPPPVQPPPGPAPVTCQTEDNLIRNCDFEEHPTPNFYAQGILPSEWLELVASPAADTYDTDPEDGIYGLRAEDYGNFTGVMAHAGKTFVASWSLIPERFGQELTQPLVAGQSYLFSGFVHLAKRSDLANPGTYQIGLATDDTANDLVNVGQLDMLSTPDVWEERVISFVAPADAANRTVLVFTPVGDNGNSTYPALDTLILSASE